MISPAFRTILYFPLFAVTFIAIPWWLVNYSVPLDLGNWAAPVGFALLLLGSGLVIWTGSLFIRLGKGTPAPFDPPRTLVTTGPFRLVRHPMYLGVFLIILGEALLWKSLLVLLYLAVFIVLRHEWVTRLEEPNLERRFGEAYREYKRRVPRWLPRMRFTV